jgi:excisionase family DNA binding protein
VTAPARNLTPSTRPERHVPDLVAYAVGLANELEETLQILRSALPDLHEPSLHGVQRRRPRAPIAMPKDSTLTATQVAAVFSCSTRTLRRLRQEGKVPKPIPFGGRLRWRRRDVEDWLAKRRVCR